MNLDRLSGEGIPGKYLKDSSDRTKREVADGAQDRERMEINRVPCL